MRGGRKSEELVPGICVVLSTRVCSDSKPEFLLG